MRVSERTPRHNTTKIMHRRIAQGASNAARQSSAVSPGVNMKAWTGMMIATAVAATLTACAPKSTVAAVSIEDKVYAVTPSSVTIRTGIVTGELTQMKVTERVEQGSGRIETPARLSGTLKLKNSSTDQTVRLLGATIRYIDSQGQLIKIEDARTEPAIRFTSSSSDRLDPGQDASQSVEVDFPADALKAKKLKELRVELTYVPSAYRRETANVAVAIGPQ
jgi:hypothetical protein